MDLRNDDFALDLFALAAAHHFGAAFFFFLLRTAIGRERTHAVVVACHFALDHVERQACLCGASGSPFLAGFTGAGAASACARTSRGRRVRSSRSSASSWRVGVAACCCVRAAWPRRHCLRRAASGARRLCAGGGDLRGLGFFLFSAAARFDLGLERFVSRRPCVRCASSSARRCIFFGAHALLARFALGHRALHGLLAAARFFIADAAGAAFGLSVAWPDAAALAAQRGFLLQWRRHARTRRCRPAAAAPGRPIARFSRTSTVTCLVRPWEKLWRTVPALAVRVSVSGLRPRADVSFRRSCRRQTCSRVRRPSFKRRQFSVVKYRRSLAAGPELQKVPASSVAQSQTTERQESGQEPGTMARKPARRPISAAQASAKRS